MIEFKQASFAWPGRRPLLHNASFSLLPGFTALAGPPASGKSSLLLLSSARLFPSQGSVLLDGRDTKGLNEDERMRCCPLVYGTMEFASSNRLEALLRQAQSGGWLAAAKNLWVEVQQALNLQKELNRPFAALTPAQKQRACLALCLLFGAPHNMLDEPMFALEAKEKEAAVEYMAFWTAFYKKNIALAAHELALCQKYANQALLLGQDGSLHLGSAADALAKEPIEQAYQAPLAVVRQREALRACQLRQQAAGGAPPAGMGQVKIYD